MLVQIEDFANTLSFDNQIEGQRDAFYSYIKFQARNPNSFWIHNHNLQYPSLNFAVNGLLATVNYFDKRECIQADWVSKSDLCEIDQEGETIFFYASETEEQGMSNALVVSSETAYQAALDFFDNPFVRPKAVEWYEL